MEAKALEILIVDDNIEDVELTIRALKKNNLANHIHHLHDGQEALDFLFSPNNTMKPRLILLDLKMPRVDGLEVLRQLKTDPDKKIIPVVVLTSSKEERDIIESYQLGVNAYIVKPVDFEKFMIAIQELGKFWLLINQPPHG